MRHFNRTLKVLSLGLPLAAGLVLAPCLVGGQVADTTPPAIVLGLANPLSYSSVLSLADGAVVTPDARGRVTFRAELTDAGSGVRRAVIAVPGASGSMFVSPTRRTFISGAWDARNAPNGARATVTVTVVDATGNPATKTLSVVLSK